MISESEFEALEKELAARNAAALKEVHAKYGDAIEAAIGKAKVSGWREAVETFDGAEAYAYPRSEGRIAWGVNSAETHFNIWRGVRRPDGADEGEM